MDLIFRIDDEQTQMEGRGRYVKGLEIKKADSGKGHSFVRILRCIVDYREHAGFQDLGIPSEEAIVQIPAGSSFARDTDDVGDQAIRFGQRHPVAGVSQIMSFP